MDVAIVKYNAGNIYSVVNAMKRLGISPILTDDAETLRNFYLQCQYLVERF